MASSITEAREQLAKALELALPPYGKKGIPGFEGVEERCRALERAIDALITERIRLTVEHLELLRQRVDRLEPPCT